MIGLRICDPLEEQLDLRAASIELGDGSAAARCQEHQALAGLWVFELDAPQ